MKTAIFGDIHANLEGLQSVLADAQNAGCDFYCCIGDIVGYNANPNECLEIVRKLSCPTVIGNHDHDCADDGSLEGLNTLAKSALEWTRKMLSDDEKTWLKNLKYVRPARGFTLVHSSLDSPESWTYVRDPLEVKANFAYQSTQICFHGHTHVAAIFTNRRGFEHALERKVKIENGIKYFVNVGSAGQPRDGDWRAAYAIYDREENSIEIRRIEYDLRLTQNKIIKARLPRMLAERLALGK